MINKSTKFKKNYCSRSKATRITKNFFSDNPNFSLHSKNKIFLERNQKGFTLMEVLVATAIFAVIMVIVTATVAQTSSYRTKLKAMRETSEETRRLADMITRDVRSANKPINVDSIASPSDARSGIYLWLVHGPTIDMSRYSIGPHTNYDTASMYCVGVPIQCFDFIRFMVLANSNEYIFYYTRVIDGQGYLFRKTYPSSGDLSSLITVNFLCSYSDPLCFVGNEDNAISNKDLNVNLDFAGYAPLDVFSPNLQQPFVKFKITAATLDQSDKNSSYTTEIDSTVTGRSYNQ